MKSTLEAELSSLRCRLKGSTPSSSTVDHRDCQSSVNSAVGTSGANCHIDDSNHTSTYRGSPQSSLSSLSIPSSLEVISHEPPVPSPVIFDPVLQTFCNMGSLTEKNCSAFSAETMFNSQQLMFSGQQQLQLMMMGHPMGSAINGGFLRNAIPLFLPPYPPTDMTSNFCHQFGTPASLSGPPAFFYSTNLLQQQFQPGFK